MSQKCCKNMIAARIERCAFDIVQVEKKYPNQVLNSRSSNSRPETLTTRLRNFLFNENKLVNQLKVLNCLLLK
jgi:hypothetical protein